MIRHLAPPTRPKVAAAKLAPTKRIGQVAAEAGVNVQTLRFYERRGLLAAPARQRSGYRAYPAETVRLVQFIKRAQELGFTLLEVEDLLQLQDDSAASCSEARTLAEAKLKAIDRKLRDLRAIKRALETLTTTCGNSAGRRCPILDALEHVPPKAART